MVSTFLLFHKPAKLGPARHSSLKLPNKYLYVFNNFLLPENVVVSIVLKSLHTLVENVFPSLTDFIFLYRYASLNEHYVPLIGNSLAIFNRLVFRSFCFLPVGNQRTTAKRKKLLHVYYSPKEILLRHKKEKKTLRNNLDTKCHHELN